MRTGGRHGSAAAVIRPRLASGLRLVAGASLGRCLRRCAAFVLHGARGQVFAFAHEAEVDLATIEVDAAHLHPHPRADGVADAGALAAQLLAHLVELEVFAAKLSDVDQALDVHRIERDEDAEGGGRGDHTAILLAEVLAHVLALEPGLDVAAGLVGAALVGAAMQAGGFPGQHFLAGRDGRLLRLVGRRLDA
ncbi:hypothetical protein D9M69_580160 [compost metagenome]